MARSTKSNAATETQTEDTKFEHYKKVGMDQLLKDHKNISGVMRFLSSEGLTVSQNAEVTGKRYQHVRNVLNQKVGDKAAQ